MDSHSQDKGTGHPINWHVATDELNSGPDNALSAATKKSQIKAACHTLDVQSLVKFASSEGGLIDDESRRLACRSIGRIALILPIAKGAH